ncbi:MAG: hypothetical protein J7605_02780 [Variovorax sp.]|nr:hypothetical protein [Variovorax sp.]
MAIVYMPHPQQHQQQLTKASFPMTKDGSAFNVRTPDGRTVRVAADRPDMAQLLASGVMKLPSPKMRSNLNEGALDVLADVLGQVLTPMQRRLKELEAETRMLRMHPETRAALQRAQASIELAEAVLS